MNPLRACVRVSSNDRQQTIRIERSIELMPMAHKHLGAVGRGVNQRTYGRNPAEQILNEAHLALVMIPGDEYYVDASPPPLNDLIHYLLLRGTPVPRRPPVPSVNDVADQVKGLRNMM